MLAVASSVLVVGAAGVAVAPAEAALVPAGVRPVAVGFGHSCAITSAGGASCWGKNTSGELGDGTTTQSNVPVSVSGLSSGVVQVGAGAGFSCALLATGSVKCWGTGANGRLGDGTSTDSSTPVQVSGLTADVTAISVGNYQACALTSGGAVMCWGSNIYGQLGQGTTTDSPVPVTVTGLSSGATAISTGAAHACAIVGGTSMRCWGDNTYSQLGGNAFGTQSNVPVTVPGIAGTLTALTTGRENTCALGSTGSVRCWGDNSHGQLGNGQEDPTPSALPLSPLYLGNDVAEIAAGSNHICALTNGGAVKCWGDNVEGNLGTGATGDSLVPEAVSGLSSGVTAIAVGMVNSCALLATGAMRCWGQNINGQNGNGRGMGLNQTVPMEVTGLSSGVSSIWAGGTSHTCATLTSGAAKCWGKNQDYQVGDPRGDWFAVPIPIAGPQFGGTAAKVVTGGRTTCMVSTNASLDCWGANNVGQLGIGGTSSTSTTDRASVAISIAEVAVGVSRTCSISNSGALNCWGSNTAGALGDGTTTSSPLPVRVSGVNTGATMVSIGTGHTCARIASAAKCWGSGANGRLGNGATTSQSTPVQVTGLTNTLAVAAGGSHSCAITSLGAARCWGLNTNGQLGNNSTTQSTTPVAVSGLASGVTAIGTGDNYSCALTSAGAVKCWGANAEGELGNGTTTGSTTPVQVTGLTSGVTKLSVGPTHACAVLSTGAAHCWGYDSYGPVGIGSLLPVDVVGGAAFYVDAPLTIAGTRTPAANAAGWSNTPVTVSFTCTGGTAPITCPGPQTFDEGTGQTASGSATDAASGSASTSVTGINVDLTPPTGNGAAVGTPTNGWFRSDVTVQWTCADVLSGVASCPGDSTLSGEGAAVTTSAPATDAAGNVATLTSGPVSIDRTAPTTTSSASPAWTTSAVDVSFEASDNLSGVADTSYSLDGGAATSGSTVTLAGDGAHDLDVWSTDQAGNVEAVQHLTVRIDGTAPSIDAQLDPAPNGAGWNRTPVTVTFTCGDGTSGVASCTAPSTVSSDGTHAVEGSATDTAGNSSATTATVHVDQTPPTITPSAPAANPAGWYRAPVPVSWECADATSGVASCTSTRILDGDGRGQSVDGAATDAAGNSTNTSLTGISIDTTDPTISASASPAADGGGWHHGPVTVHFTCDDTTSGVDSCPEDQVVGTPGISSVTGTAVDVAGNQATTAISVKIDASIPVASATVTSADAPTFGVYASAATVHLTATDDVGIDHLTWAATGAGATPTTTVSGASADLTVSATGATTITYWATDTAGQVSAHGTVSLRIDPRPVLSIAGSSSVLEPDNASTRGAYFQVNLSRPAATSVTFTYFTRDGSATGCASGPCDYTRFGSPSSPRTATIPAGATQLTFSVPVNPDGQVEGEEAFSVVVAGSNGAVLSSQDTAETTIVDVDSLSQGGRPVLMLTPRNEVVEGDTAMQKGQVVISLSKALDQAITITYRTTDLTATAPRDYRAIAPTTITIPAGSLTRTIDVAIYGNLLTDGDRHLLIDHLAITPPPGVDLVDVLAGADIGILDDDRT